MGDINQDPSMEEILASIKRVIADDGRAPPAPRSHRPSTRQEPEPAPPEPFAPEPVAQEEEEDVLELSVPMSEADGLISQDTAATTRQSLATLAAMRQSGELQLTVPATEGPLETVVREMLRPMLKDWLDERLPEMVEELVAREIARITGKSL